MSITIASIVDVYWENIEHEYDVEVIHIPQATGDSWILKRKDGTRIRVNNFCKMVEKG